MTPGTANQPTNLFVRDLLGNPDKINLDELTIEQRRDVALIRITDELVETRDEFRQLRREHDDVMSGRDAQKCRPLADAEAGCKARMQELKLAFWRGIAMSLLFPILLMLAGAALAYAYFRGH